MNTLKKCLPDAISYRHLCSNLLLLTSLCLYRKARFFSATIHKQV